MSCHPIDLVVIDNANVIKGDVRGFAMAHERLRFATPSDVAATDLGGQFGGIYIAALKADFDLDTASSADADDFDTVVDMNGNRFSRVESWLVFTES